jgi:uroporphyrinogen III methyltransferase/synthase
MTVYLVGAGPGDPGLLTRRGAQLLSEADVVLFDRLVHHSILALVPESAELIDVGKRPDGTRPGAASQLEINELLIDHGRRCHIVVRLKGGDPFVFGRGGEEAEALARAGVRCEVVPGVSSAFGVPAVVGIPVTHRGLSSSVTVVTGRTDDPTAPGSVNWEALAQVGGTLVILMGMMSRTEIAEALIRSGKPPSTPTAVIERGATPNQVVVRTTLGQLPEVELGSPAVIVVGPVASLGAGGEGDGDGDPATTPEPLTGRTVVVTRSGPRARDVIDVVRGLGAEVIELPLTTQSDPADDGAALQAAAKEIDRFRWVVLTSVNAVARFMAELRDARALASTLVAAVGPATADALRRLGVEADLVASEPSASGLVAAFPDHDPADPDDPHDPNDRVLFPCADLAPDTIPDGLESKGWTVRRVEAYRTVPLPPPAPGALGRVADADAVIFTAGSAVTAYAALVGPDGLALRVPPLVVCIGSSTAGHARTVGMAGIAEAREASTQGIVDALVHRLAGAPAGGS